MHLAHFLGFVHKSQGHLAEAFREVGESHAEDVDIFHLTQKLARQCDDHAERLRPFADRYGEDAPEEPERLHGSLFEGTRKGPVGLLRDLQDLYVMAAEVDITWTLVGQAAQGARDSDLLEVVLECEKETATQMDWLRTRMKQAAPQVLVVAE